MRAETPTVVIASASVQERRKLELALKETGWNLYQADTAGDAARAVAAGNGSCVLVIDSGLLQMNHDSQWRLLRERHPGLGAVVRCLVPPGEIRRRDESTFLVHPDDEDGTCRAVRLLR